MPSGGPDRRGEPAGDAAGRHTGASATVHRSVSACSSVGARSGPRECL